MVERPATFPNSDFLSVCASYISRAHGQIPQLATLMLLKRGSHLSLCVILDGLAGLELLAAVFALAECDGCKFDDLENSFHIQLYRSKIASASESILISPVASLLRLIAAFRVSA